MTEAQFLKVKFGDILNYTFHDGKTEKVKVVQTYRFAGGGRISAVVLNEQAEKDTIERACDVLMNYVFEEVTPEMRDHFRKRLEEE